MFGFIGGIFIAPDRQGMGIGRKLIAHALDQKGELSLEVYLENEQAVRFYSSLGFREASRRDVDDFGCANEPSLRKRLKLFYGLLVSLVGSEPYGFKSSSIEPLVQTRNYCAHYPEDSKGKILSPSSTVRETDRFSMLLVVCLFHEIGLTLALTRNGLFLHDKFRRFMDGMRAQAGTETQT